MSSQKTKSRLAKPLAAGIIAAVVAFVIACVLTLLTLRQTLIPASERTMDDFSDIMDRYTHSFEMYESNLQLEIAHADSASDVSDYLKANDQKFREIDGDDYDGVYMYYNGEYLYSWDVPIENYIQNGYVATERPWYTGAVAADGDICFSVPYRSYAYDYMLATISRLQPDGKTVIAYDIKLGAIQGYTSRLNLYNGSLTVVCDKSGNIIGSTNPQYAGGNYLYTAQQYQQQIDEAKAELANATGSDTEKAQMKVDNLIALQQLTIDKQSSLASVAAAPEHVHVDLPAGLVSYAHCDGAYDVITLLPLTRLLPMIGVIWLLGFTIFFLSILMVYNGKIRIQHARELKQKNTELAAAVVRADAANVAKSQFLAQMSHEIRTPMNAIIGLTGIAKAETHDPEKVTEYLTKIEGSSRLLLSIINDVLDMSAIEGGKLKIDSSEFDFKALLTNITSIFYEQARRKGVDFEVHLNGVTEERIIGDELRVNQILMNLLSNAVKFTPAGGKITLTVLQASRTQNKVQLRFSVADTGCGMSEEMMGRLFRPFEQESASTARKHGGSGLGLSITKRLVEMMGGTIQVKSSPDKGSVFSVDIPFTVSEDAGKPITLGDFSKIHALIVDDSLEACEYCGSLLGNLGVRYEYVTNGEAALEALENAEDQGDPITLCLIDWKMPGMDGGELTRKIREIFGDDALIVIVSAYDINEVESSGDITGSNYYMPKPLFRSTLFNALMKITSVGQEKLDLAHETTDYSFAGKRVLVAEDVALNMEVAVKLLSMVGIKVTCAEDGRQAVELFEKSPAYTYDCILLDINMPVMDGYEAARALRKLHRDDAATVPIYAMTANAFSEDVTAALDAGMNGHIAKPIETKVLYRTLETAFAAKENNNANSTNPESEKVE